MASISITRATGYYYGALASVAIEVNGNKVAGLHINDTHTMAVKPGPTTLSATMFGSPGRFDYRFNAYYDEADAPDIDEDTYRLALDGLIENKQPWALDQLYALPQETQITRLICVEGWSAIGKWTGAPLGDFLRRIGADLTARYVHFVCAEGYSVSIDMPTALHNQTQMTFKFDGEVLPTKFGFPMRIRMPTKLGFKNPKHVVGLAVLNNYTGGYWEDRGYNWFSGL